MSVPIKREREDRIEAPEDSYKRIKEERSSDAAVGCFAVPEAVPAVILRPAEIISIDDDESSDDAKSHCSTDNDCNYASGDSSSDEEIEFSFYMLKGDPDVYCKFCRNYFSMKNDFEFLKEHVTMDCEPSEKIRMEQRKRKRHERRKQRRGGENLK